MGGGDPVTINKGFWQTGVTTAGGVYTANKPDCAHCGKPIEDADARVQRAGKVYHRDRALCHAAYDRAGVRP